MGALRPLVGCTVRGSLWWLPFIGFHQGGTAMYRKSVVLVVVVVLTVLGVSQLNAQGIVTLADVIERLDLLSRDVEVQNAYSDTLATKIADVEDRLEALENPPTPTPDLTPVIIPTSTSIPTSTPEPAPETVLVVTIARGNVRAGPGTQHAIVGSVSQGDTLEGPYEEAGGWYQFCCIESGEKAWISSTLVSVRDEGELTDWENARRNAIEVDPDTLLRYNADYVNKLVYFSNVRVFQGADNFVLVFLDASYDYVGYLIYENASPRVLKDDRIDFVARVEGIHTYKSTGDRMISAPLLEVVELRLTN